MGGGGYVAGPVGVAALSLRIPLVLTEADSHLGLTNRLLAPFARRVCLAFPLAGPRRAPATASRAARCRRRRATATPRASASGSAPRRPACSCSAARWARARSTWRRVEAFAGAPFHVLHVSGTRDHARAGGAPAAGGLRPARVPRRSRDFAEALAAADLVVARAGGSVFEIAAHGLPAILVPYPHAAGDHQSANARWMAEAGAAIVIADGELTGARLGGEVAALLADRARLARWRRPRAALARPDAAREVAERAARGRRAR